MAILKQIKFGTGAATPIAKTVVKSKSGGVIEVTNTDGRANDETEQKDYSYDIDVNVDGTTIVKDGGKLAVGTVPAAQVSVAEGTGLKSTEAQAAFTELKEAIDKVGGAAKSYTIVKTTGDLAANVKEQYKLQQKVGSTTEFVGEPINIYKDSSLKSVALDGQVLNFTYILADGTESTVGVDVSTFLAESEFGHGLDVNNHIVSVQVDTASEKFLSVGEAGVRLSGVQNAINTAVRTAVEDLDVTDAAEAGMYVSTVSETDGKIAVKRANVSDAVLNGYAKGTDATAIAETDSLKVALGKLENQVEKAKAAATTKVAKGTDEGNNLTISNATGEDGSTTYTINLTDVASKAALDAEIAARGDADTKLTQDLAAEVNRATAAEEAEVTRAKLAETAIDSVVGLAKAAEGETRTFTPTTNYGGKTATVKANMQAIDNALKSVDDRLTVAEGKVAGIQYDVEGTTLVFYGIEKKTKA